MSCLTELAGSTLAPLMSERGARDETEKHGGGVDAVDRALAILAAFEPGHETQTLARLAARTGLYKSTLLRLACSLERAGYLHRAADGRFSLGAEPLRLAAVYRRAARLETFVRPFLRALADETGESASFFRREGNRRICVFREETHHAIRDHVAEGDALPLDRGAGGHVLTKFGAANLSTAARAKLFAALPFASFGERDPETAAVAVPVFGHEGLSGALVVSAPRARLGEPRARTIGVLLRDRARRLTQLLGGESWEE